MPTLSDLVKDVLAGANGGKFTAAQLAIAAIERSPTWAHEKRSRSKVIRDERELVEQVSREIHSHRMSFSPSVKISEGPPRLFYWSDKSDERLGADARPTDISLKIAPADPDKFAERDLYPKLSTYLWSEWKLYSKRIDETRSSNGRGSGGNKWLYPDIVAVKDLTKNWTDTIKDCVDARKDRISELWSFEVKRQLNRSNVRECFSQALSNSAWANFGYLVVAQIAGDDETMDEFRMLHGLHGIGLIRLNPDDPAESQVVVYARQRSEIDWDTCNRIVHANSDFKHFIECLAAFHKSRKLSPSDWDVPKDLQD